MTVMVDVQLQSALDMYVCFKMADIYMLVSAWKRRWVFFLFLFLQSTIMHSSSISQERLASCTYLKHASLAIHITISCERITHKDIFSSFLPFLLESPPLEQERKMGQKRK